ncbi:MAG: peptidoglycan DD-metalloendopeptidase family protein [Alphaproteobacteria bacterium]|nr:peptidoglycan DD-metalloendopeptidase family protein [Alphaproteobacteria bacterium]
MPAHAQEIRFENRIVQGALVVGSTAPGSRVALDGQPVRVAADGKFVVGFAREAKAARLDVTAPDGRTKTLDLKVEPRRFDIQRIDGLPEAQVTPDPAALARIEAENVKIVAARHRDTALPLFESGFRWPVTGPISGVYGSQRILNGKPRAPHLGVDVARPTGTPVAAAADGIVSLAEKDLFFTGGTLMIDHGHGVTSVYAHLSRLDVAVGTRVNAGEIVGAIGATGRVTGPHLHWGLTWFDVRLDPQLLVPAMPVE